MMPRAFDPYGLRRAEPIRLWFGHRFVRAPLQWRLSGYLLFGAWIGIVLVSWRIADNAAANTLSDPAFSQAVGPGPGKVGYLHGPVLMGLLFLVMAFWRTFHPLENWMRDIPHFSGMAPRRVTSEVVFAAGTTGALGVLAIFTAVQASHAMKSAGL